MYGLTTGVGPQKTVAVTASEQEHFDHPMVLGHCVGHDETGTAGVRQGYPCRARAEGLALGAAGVRPSIAEALLQALERRSDSRRHLIGSIGQSDRSQMAEIARTLIGAGEGAEQLTRAGLRPLRLAHRAALGLTSSNALSVGIAALAPALSFSALQALELSAALAFEGYAANVSALTPDVATTRPHHGIQATIDQLRELLAGGALLLGTRPPRKPPASRVFSNPPASARGYTAPRSATPESCSRPNCGRPG